MDVDVYARALQAAVDDVLQRDSNVSAAAGVSKQRVCVDSHAECVLYVLLAA